MEEGGATGVGRESNTIGGEGGARRAGLGSLWQDAVARTTTSQEHRGG